MFKKSLIVHLYFYKLKYFKIFRYVIIMLNTALGGWL